MLDFGGRARIGLTEAVLCERKSPDKISDILGEHLERKVPCLLTRLSQEKLSALSDRARTGIDYDGTSVGYGVVRDGQLNLYSALGSCAPGVVAVNIDNGYGAACAVLHLLNGLGD